MFTSASFLACSLAGKLASALIALISSAAIVANSAFAAAFTLFAVVTLPMAFNPFVFAVSTAALVVALLIAVFALFASEVTDPFWAVFSSVVNVVSRSI